MIIAIALPNNAAVSWKFVERLMTVASYDIRTAMGSYCYVNKNRLFEKARTSNQDILYIDSDMVFTFADVEAIANHLKEKEIVGGVYAIGAPPYPAALYKKTDNDYELCEPEEGVNKVDAIGGAFFGISKEAVQKMPKDPFTPVYEDKVEHGDDISFCHRARELDIPIWCDSAIRIGHLREKAIYVS